MRTEFELKQLSGWWFDLSKIILGSFAIKLFEPVQVLSVNSLFVLLAILITSLSCVRVGVRFAKKVKS